MNKLQPQIYLLARPRIDADGIHRFLQDTNAQWRQTDTATEAERMIEFAGRICYMSFGAHQSARDNREYIRNLIISGHESVLEHVSWTFLITGVSRGFSHQLVRHRVGIAFSQMSQQYHDEKDAEFVVPTGIDKHPEALRLWEEQTTSALEAYRQISDLLRADAVSDEAGLTEKEKKRLLRSIARSVLPAATETKIVMTGNARALRHFLEVRGTIPGDIEMRVVASELLRILTVEAPSVFFDFAVEVLEDDGSPIVCHKDPH